MLGIGAQCFYIHLEFVLKSAGALDAEGGGTKHI